MLTLIAALPRATTYDNMCKEGARYLESATYGASAASWSADLAHRGGWRGAVLGPDGDSIYGIPCNASTVLEVDVATKQIRTFGHLGPEPTERACSGRLHCGIDKWIGGVVGLHTRPHSLWRNGVSPF